MLSFFTKKWANFICSDAAVKREQTLVPVNTRSVNRCVSCPLSLAFSSFHPEKIVPCIYGSLFFPSENWTWSASKIVCGIPKSLTKWVLHEAVNKDCIFLKLANICFNDLPEAAADYIGSIHTIFPWFMLTRSSSPSPSHSPSPSPSLG